MITIIVPTDKLVLNVYDKRARVSIKDLNASQLNTIAQKLVDTEGKVSLREITIYEGF